MRNNILYTAILVAAAPAVSVAQEVTDSVPEYTDLDEFVVTVKKEVVKSDGANLTYDLEQDDTSKGQTLLDALRKVPMITVDGQDNIYVKGNSNFRIYVNGKEDPMLTANYQKMFKSMPAESVSKIEVITEPGAKYDSEGTGGVINLVTQRKQTKEGYTGSVTLTGGNQQFGGSLYGRMRHDKITADASVNVSNNSLQENESFNETRMEDKQTHDVQKTDIYQKSGVTYIGGNLNLSWEPTEKDLFTVGGDMNWIDGTINEGRMRNKMISSAGDVLWSNMQNSDGSKLRNYGVNGNVSYRRMLPGEGHSLTGAYRFSFNKSAFYLGHNNSNETGPDMLPPFQSSSNDSYQREHTATLDYLKAFCGGKHTLEAGAKGIFRRNSSLVQAMAGESRELAVPIEEDGNGVAQLQDIYAAYAAYTGTYGKWVVNGGVRYEHTYMGVDDRGGNKDGESGAGNGNFRNRLNDVTPNASVTYMFGPANNLRLAYGRRITRPSISQVNPTLFRINQTIATKGNPDLESEKTDKLSLTYSNFGPVLGGNVGVTLSQTNNAIDNYSYMEDDVMIQTVGNIGRNRRVEFSGYLNWHINQRMTASVNGMLHFTDIKSFSRGMANSGWKGDYGANYSYSAPMSWKFSAYGGGSTGMIKLQGETTGWYYYGLAITKSFLKDDALKVTLSASNFLTKYLTGKSHEDTGTHLTSMTWHVRSWNVGVSVSWNFGHLEDHVKSTGANLTNDDASKASAGGTGSGSGGIGM